MTSADLVRVIEKESRQLAKGLAEEMTANLGTSHYRRLKTEELYQRIEAAYRLLARWLTTGNETEVREVNEGIGRARFEEGIPLGQVVLALILAEKHLWDYLQDRGWRSQDGKGEAGVRRAVTEFYEKAVHSTGRGYEVRLAESNRLARRAVAGQPEAVAAVSSSASKLPPSKASAANILSDLEVSRGGQVGEFGG